MPKRLIRTYYALQDCERHLNDTGASGTEIESYLTQYLLIILCADMQQEIYQLSEEKAKTANNAALSLFVAASARKILRSIGKKEIAGYIGMFGSDCKEKLNGVLTDAEVTIYNNAVSNRHEVAHSQGIHISFIECKDAIKVADKIVEAAAYSLGLGPAPG